MNCYSARGYSSHVTFDTFLHEAMYQHVAEEVIVGCGGDKFG